MGTHSSWLQKIQSLPVLPQVAMRVTERMQSSTATLPEIAELIKSDVGLSTKVLRLANSSYYSIPGGVTEVSKALQFLGFTTIAQIVLTSSVFGAFQSQGTAGFPLSRFWLHCFAVGLLAEMTSKNLKLGNPSEAFVGGLLHDIGKLILLELAPEQLQKTLRHSLENKISFIEAETALGFHNHVQLGVEIARHWKLPSSIQNAIASHHIPSRNKEWALIEWANLWVNASGIGFSGNTDEKTLLKLADCQTRLGITAPASSAIETQFRKEFEKAGAILHGH
ncbi:HDOD domain-containing protein [bacterium]|jgi:putative nucleotidyltransferase with HDIG domain|nr:HDOD domain-containing protein [bacterium]